MYQSVHVSVPVTEELMELGADGKRHVDPHKVFAAAVDMGADHGIEWSIDDSVIEPHPEQTPPGA